MIKLKQSKFEVKKCQLSIVQLHLSSNAIKYFDPLRQYMLPDLTKADLNTHSKQTHFLPPVVSSIHQLTTNDYFPLQFTFHGLFPWPMWHP